MRNKAKFSAAVKLRENQSKQPAGIDVTVNNFLMGQSTFGDFWL